MQVSLLAMGAGTSSTMTAESRTALREAGCLVGAVRLLKDLPEEYTQNRVAATKPQAIWEALQAAGCEKAAVLYSGDTGFYSGCRSLIPLLEAQKIPYTVYPGLSSLQLLAAALHRPWQDWTLVSAHGVKCDAVAAVMRGKPAFFLTGGSLGVPELCAQLSEAGLGALPVTVGENLGYSDEKISQGTAEEMVVRQFGPLCVLLAEAAPVPPRRTPGWPDEVFLRGNVPMTKRFVRAAILAALGPEPGETIWDVGAGTGSVSVELAAAVAGGAVYAVECEAAALALIHENRNKFHTWNLRVVEGAAPQALTDLPAPDAVFVGGSKGKMQEILALVLRKNSKVRLCISCIALETLETVLSFCREHDLVPEVAQLAVSEGKTMGTHHLLMAQNPIFLITVHGND